MRTLVAVVVFFTIASANRAADLDAVPEVPEGFKAVIVAKEPSLLHPGALAFDAKGRLFVGGGPQFRRPTKQTPPDSIKILIDKDSDGVADEVKTFGTGFNCIQALAWKGDDLYVANCPDVTIVRDTDGDDVADEYQLVYTGLGHLRHGLHGFNFGPDGKLYMTQGNSTAQKHAPKPWRELMHIDSDEPDNQPINKVFKPNEYKHSHIGSWPSSEGGILRCDPDGNNLEIFSRGNRNPWDAAFDDEFNWLGTDNDDGPEHDRIFSPFHGSHFGKVHPWSYSWTGKGNPATVPASGLFPSSGGSGVGVVFYQSEQFPKAYRNTFMIGDWTRECVYLFKRQWDGALLTGELSTIIKQGKALFRPTDLAVGPDGALYVAGWGSRYGSKWAPHGGGDKRDGIHEGRVFRIWYDKAPLVKWDAPKRNKPYAKWSAAELVEDLGHQIAVWRVNAQDELVRRGPSIVVELFKVLADQRATTAKKTWALWAIGRIAPESKSANKTFADLAGDKGESMNIRTQALRILALRQAENATAAMAQQLSDAQPRIRFEAAQALRQIGARDHAESLLNAAAKETDRIAYYAMWRTLGEQWSEAELKELLTDNRAGVRRAALLALLENDAMDPDDVLPLTIDSDEPTAAIAQLWMKKAGKSGYVALAMTPAGGEFFEPIEIKLVTPIEGAVIHYTTDGSEPTAKSPKFKNPFNIEDDSVVKAALYRDGKPLGSVVSETFDKLTEEQWKSRLIISELRVRNNQPYRIAEGGLRENALVYIDRKYEFRSFPDELRGITFIRTANDDSSSKGEAYFSFRVNQPVKVYVAHDKRIRTKPQWMRIGSDDGFKDTGKDLRTSDTDFRLFEKEFKPGVISFGGNLPNEGGGSNSMYQVFIRKAGPAIKLHNTTLAQVKRLLGKGDAKRGRDVFFRETVGCAKCHQLGGKGINVGPDLRDAGLRLKPEKIAVSILDPNAEVIEGYVQHMVETLDGDRYFGLMREESGKSLTLHLMNEGKSKTFAKKDIAEHRVLASSAMPANYHQLLAAQEAADIVTWLMAQKEKVPDKKGVFPKNKD